MENSRTKNSVINVITGIGGQLFSTILKFIVRTVFIHTLGSTYLGINGLFSDILTMLSLTELGLDTAINFQLYKPLAEKNTKRVRVLMKFYKSAYRVVGVAIFVLGMCIIPFLPVLIKDYDSLDALGISATVIFSLHLMRSISSYLFFAYRSAILKANQKKYILDVVTFLVEVANSIAKILVLVFLRNFVLYTATVILFNIITNMINAMIAKKMYPDFFEKEEERLSKEEIKGLFKDCGALFVYRLNTVVLKATDNMVLSSFVGLTIVGKYSNYLLFYNTIKSFTNRIFAGVSASAGNLYATATVEKKYKFFEVMNFISILIFGTAGIGLACCSNEIIHLWVSDEYVIPQPFPILIGVEMLFTGMTANLGQIRNISGAFRQMWFRPVIGMVINLGVSIALVQVLGIYGVIIGTIVSIVLTNFIVDPRIIHRFSLENYRPVSQYYKKNAVYFALLALIGGVDMWICTVLTTGNGWLTVVLHIAIVLISVPGVFILVFRNSHECKYLIQLVKKILKRKGKNKASK